MALTFSLNIPNVLQAHNSTVHYNELMILWWILENVTIPLFSLLHMLKKLDGQNGRTTIQVHQDFRLDSLCYWKLRCITHFYQCLHAVTVPLQ